MFGCATSLGKQDVQLFQCVHNYPVKHIPAIYISSSILGCQQATPGPAQMHDTLATFQQKERNKAGLAAFRI